MSHDYDDTDAMLNEMMARGREAQNSASQVREQQVSEIHEATAKQVCSHRPDYPQEVYRTYLNAHILRAEARGAEEQRRKDAEFAKLIAEKSAKIRLLGEDLQSQDGDYAEEVPANVAALEARVKVLEEALEHECWCMSDSGEGLKAINAGHIVQIWLRDEIEKIRAALTREGGE